MFNLIKIVDIHCYDCGEDFKIKTGGFKKHIYVEGCKPYICVTCSQLFTRKRKMTAHFRKCTNKEIEKLNSL